MSKKTVFWLCQIGGWLLVASINFLVQSFRSNFDWSLELLANFMFFLVGVAGTLLLRRLFLRVDILNKKPLSAMLVAFLLSAIIALVIVFGVLSAMEIFDTFGNGSVFTVNMIVGNYVAVFPIVIVWATIYLTIQFLLKLRQTEIDKIALSAALKDAQLNTLIGQINPHFMFNALNNIRSLMLEDVDRARDGVTHLANVLRYSLTSTKQTQVSLQEEVKVVEDYIELSKIHLEDRLSWQTEISVDLHTTQLPPMFIQILVENAIKHGISEVKGGGHLLLKIAQVENNLNIEVLNTGSLQRSEKRSDSTGIGLENIKQRLLLLFGQSASFSLQQQGDFVCAKLILPMTQSMEVSE
jgi:sensor histidine kinase YesM